MNLNPMLNQTKRKQSQPSVRKKRSDSKVDIRIPIKPKDREFVLYAARNRRESITSYATGIVKAHLDRRRDFPQQVYEPSDFIVHVKATPKMYEAIVVYSIKWNCSIREATHRIFSDALFREQGGVYVEGI
ncbi:hypothetical protein M3689_07080 [Alkalihalophilus marmarensis]|uniref:Uncharacterized protein n=1 Tax=Alkalihalophilus marmarensis DSM 21297 TaxID=1188261 RepID=U6SQ77_9BACI|nr:hypothetical protein [Alkalihalophilus marmarensis]ERN52806.1 hypothetical protein A33I_14005 [Alkalihalophilus marmarensis DSM 21297]MCM3489056.1 hypothetical protein [Alkalihalophilus marmarensis]